MVQDSEAKAQLYLRKQHGGKAFIRKMPDYKQTGSMIGGLPDYIVIDNCNTVWYEVKKLNMSKKSFSINEFTKQQLQVFIKMINAGASITMIIYWGKESYELFFDDMVHYLKEKGRMDKSEIARRNLYGKRI